MRASRIRLRNELVKATRMSQHVPIATASILLKGLSD
jgi:hypothetical protein